MNLRALEKTGYHERLIKLQGWSEQSGRVLDLSG
jgi:hypothetical protein